MAEQPQTAPAAVDEKTTRRGFREAEHVAETPTLEQSVEQLSRYGGFAILETTVEGARYLDPEKKARKDIFLTDDDKKAERKALKKRLESWRTLLSENNSALSALDAGQQRINTTTRRLTSNLAKALKAARELEQSYRSVSFFFKNAQADKIKNVSFVNTDLEQLTDPNDSDYLEVVRDELSANYDRLDLRDNYSLMVIPGYLKRKKTVDAWAQIANANKVMLITDFMHSKESGEVMKDFAGANLTGGDQYLSNVMMTCNWLVGRGRYQELGEPDDLPVPPSGALAGLVYKTLMSQPGAGRKHGALNDADGVTFKIRKSEISDLDKLGLIPMVNEYGKVMAFSAKTLFNGDNLGLQTYSVVRVFDYVTKVLIDFLNRRAFENFDFATQMDLQRQIVKFLDSITGSGKLIEKFKIIRFEQDPDKKDRIFLDIHMVPYFPAKTFVIKLDGQKGDDPDSAEWKAEYNQQ